MHRSSEQKIVGIITLDRSYSLIKGNVACCESHSYPVIIRKVKGLFNPPSPPLFESQGLLKKDVSLFLESCRCLEESGVNVIIGSCGFFSLLQDLISSAIGIPFYSSPLLLIPLLLKSQNAQRSICVVTLYRESLTREYFESCGVNNFDRIVLTNMNEATEFNEMIKNDSHNVDFGKIEDEIVVSIRDTLIRSPNIGMILLECSDMPPFTERIKKEFGLPVFDYFSLISMIQQSIHI